MSDNKMNPTYGSFSYIFSNHLLTRHISSLYCIDKIEIQFTCLDKYENKNKYQKFINTYKISDKYKEDIVLIRILYYNVLNLNNYPKNIRTQLLPEYIFLDSNEIDCNPMW